MELYDKEGKKRGNINNAAAALNTLAAYTIAYFLGSSYIGLAPTNILEYISVGLIIAVIAILVSVILQIPVEIIKHFMEDEPE